MARVRFDVSEEASLTFIRILSEISLVDFMAIIGTAIMNQADSCSLEFDELIDLLHTSYKDVKADLEKQSGQACKNCVYHKHHHHRHHRHNSEQAGDQKQE